MASESVAIEKLPNVCPRFVVWENDSLEELSREEQAMIGFRRCLPDALKPEFDKLLADDGRPVGVRLEEFKAKADPYRKEIVSAGWTPWA